MKTLKLETCKRLTEAGVLDNVGTESMYWQHYTQEKFQLVKWEDGDCNCEGVVSTFKAPNLEEALELLPKRINSHEAHFIINISRDSYTIGYNIPGKGEYLKGRKGGSLLDLVERMINHLLDNELIGK